MGEFSAAGGTGGYQPKPISNIIQQGAKVVQLKQVEQQQTLATYGQPVRGDSFLGKNIAEKAVAQAPNDDGPLGKLNSKDFYSRTKARNPFKNPALVSLVTEGIGSSFDWNTPAGTDSGARRAVAMHENDC